MPRRRPDYVPSTRGYRGIRCTAPAVPVSDLAVSVTNPGPDNRFDNQVVVEVDGVPFLDRDLEHIHGGDPEVLLGPAGLLLPGDEPHRAPLGVPTECVAESCGVAATVFRDGELTGWQPQGDRWNHGLLRSTLYFDAEQYLFAVESAWDDRRWERPTRATARLRLRRRREPARTARHSHHRGPDRERPTRPTVGRRHRRPDAVLARLVAVSQPLIPR